MSWEGLSPLTPYTGHPDPRLRKIAYCDYLHSSHPEAQTELEEALSTEPDLVLREYIRTRIERAQRQKNPEREMTHPLDSKPQDIGEWKDASLENLLAVFQHVLVHKDISYLPMMREILEVRSDARLKACFLRLSAVLEFQQFDEFGVFLEDEDSRVVLLCCEILNNLGSSRAMASLITLANHQSGEIRKRVLGLLMSHGESFLSILLREVLLARQDLVINAMTIAVACACSLRFHKGPQILLHLLEDGDERVRSAARAGFEKVYRKLPAPFQARVDQVAQIDFELGLEEIQAYENAPGPKKPAGDAPPMEREEAILDPDSLVDMIRKLAVSEDSDQKKLRIFMNYLYHPHPRIRQVSLEWLGSGLPTPLLHILSPVLQDPDPQVRSSAALVLLNRNESVFLFEEEIFKSALSLVEDGENSLALEILQNLESEEARSLAGEIHSEAVTLPELEEKPSAEFHQKQEVRLPGKEQIFSNPYQYLTRLEEILQSGTEGQKIDLLKKLLNYEVVPDPAEALILIRSALAGERESRVLRYLIDVIGILSFGDEWGALEPYLNDEREEVKSSAVKALSKLGDLRVLPHLVGILDQNSLNSADLEILEYSFEILRTKRPDMGITVISRILDEGEGEWARIQRILEEWECPPTDINGILIERLVQVSKPSMVRFILEFIRENGGKWDLPRLKKARSKTKDSSLKLKIEELEGFLSQTSFQKPRFDSLKTSSRINTGKSLTWTWATGGIGALFILLWLYLPTDLFLKNRDFMESSAKVLVKRSVHAASAVEGSLIGRELILKPPLQKLKDFPGWSQGLYQNRLVYIRGFSGNSKQRVIGVVIEEGPLGSLYLQFQP